MDNCKWNKKNKIIEKCVKAQQIESSPVSLSIIY